MKRARSEPAGAVATVRATQQSAAEFFSEHQQIAGFDNPGKSLYTTVREFVENSLDAAESIQILPDVQVTIREYTEEEHNEKHGIDTGIMGKLNAAASLATGEDFSTTGIPAPSASKPKAKGAGRAAGESKEKMYYDICCKDNGCGIAPEQIGNMLGRVLSGSKQGLKQTRGKFGLGAKMALIWSKKSSGLPITIRSAHSNSLYEPPEYVTTMVLDIDIHRNEPRVISTRKDVNTEGWRGLEIMVTICGTWSNYRSRMLQYFQQLAVITPYAELKLDFECLRDDKKSFSATFVRRSEQMPPCPKVVLPHPKSMNNITLSNLLKLCPASISLSKFLTSELSGISPSLANRIASTVGLQDTKNLRDTVSPQQIAAVCQILRDEPTIKPPSGGCLSPAGEYNMRLGVLKELLPNMVATFTDKSGVYEGQPFLVEAAISLGGRSVREGINVFRFANRIPMLFESGADVITQVAMKRINWSSYLIDPKKESVGVYVSVVSTRIPFKGTSKEYIGDDVIEIQQSVRRALIGCCQQLRTHLARSLAKREHAERRKALLRYIPDVSRAVMIVLEKMAVNQKELPSDPTLTSTRVIEEVLRKYNEGFVSEEMLSGALESSVNRLENSGASAIETAGDAAAGPEASTKTAKSKAATKARSSNFRLGQVGQSNLGLQHSMFEPFTSSFSSSTPLKLEDENTTLSPVTRDHPIELDLDEEKEVAEAEAATPAYKKLRRGAAASSQNHAEAGRWLQICNIDAKIWVEC